MVTRGSDRAQLLLVGAIGVAFIIVGMAVVVNSMVLSGVGESSEAVTAGGDVERLNHEVRRDTRSLVIHTNHYEVYEDASGLNASLRSNVTEYSRLLGSTYARSGGAFVDVSFVGRNRTGTRIVQSTDAEFTGTGGQTDHTLLGPTPPNTVGVGSPGPLGWFVMNVNASETSDRTKGWFTVVVVGDDGERLELSMNQNATGEGVSSALDVESDVSTTPGADGNVTCISTGDRVLIDVVAGRCVNDPTKRFRTVDSLASPYRVRFANGSDAVGKYALVTNRTTTPNCASGDAPCRAPAAWSVDVSVTYRTEQVAYRNVQPVTVYNESG
jgi:hypothetical protein